MKFLEVLYYYYYLFYTRILPDDEPHATVVFTLSFSLSILMNFILQVTFISLYCYSLGRWEMIAVLLVIILINYLLFLRSKRNIDIVKEEPKLFRSSTFSLAISVFFFLLTTSMLFWGAFYTKSLLSQCR